VGEVRLPMNMNILPMVTGADETGYGAFAGEELQYWVRNFLRTGNDYDQTVRLFAQQVPFIPLFFRQGIVAYPINFCSNIIATEQDIFYNIEDWVLL
jgi:peptide/nickel transport system substrate-binding protein